MDTKEMIPTIGILTMPITPDKNTADLTGSQYILQANDLYMRLGGSNTIAIPFDISPEDLKTLLPQINGVLFTGGMLEMKVDHPYYQTAKRIYQYCKDKKDKDGEEFPILGTCQGF
jgi:gamma-glutamyl-gamma-aminobutyrate hydrolase PuuD